MTTLINPLREEYLKHIKKQKDSGLSIKAYCDQNNLIEHKFVYYRDYKVKKSKTHAPVQKFSEVKIKDPEPTIKIDPVWLAQFVHHVLNSK